MCFSAAASLTAGSMLSITGLLSLSYTKTIAQRMIAAIPLFFGIQQLAEGMVWKGMEQGNELWVTSGSYLFLFFAFFVWPVWVPLSMHFMTKNIFRKKIIIGTLFIGLTVGIYLMHNITTSGLMVTISNAHIVYEINIDQFKLIGSIAYLIATIVPFFVIQLAPVNIMGTTIALSYVITYLYYTQALISVWCFFAALISLGCIFITHYLKRKNI